MSLTTETGFAPIIGSEPKILILGSMPGIASLEAVEYYAHPRNAFWKIICDTLQLPFPDHYNQKLNLIKQNHIALWDVIQTCKRQGSLDSAIEKDSIIENDIINLIKTYPSITKIGLNGGKAWDIFKKQYIKTNLLSDHIYYEKLPSTSPAFTKSYREKLELWRNFLLVNK